LACQTGLDKEGGGLVKLGTYDVETVRFVRAVVRESGGMQSDVTVRARSG